MKITKYIHSCVLIEENGEKLLFDPGSFTFADGVTPETFADVNLIVATHIHADHIDIEATKRISELSGAPVLATPEIQTKLLESGFTGEVHNEKEFTLGAFSLKAVDAPHEAIMGVPSMPENYAYIVNGRVAHPGDSLSANVAGLGADVLLLPIVAPWGKDSEMADFAQKVAPKKVIPIHEGYVKDFFLRPRHQAFGRYLEPAGIEVISLLPGESVEV